ncbi:hypothetical protein CVV38_04240 [Candidatus Peregrinibacteria bacterium HGW-Peregrinibacteria-1]|jgi:prepilin-type N-terminal cleavage/methylation domain-containing protein|nr:MAG: hypothetical protein CVV38_04240 [Candidatus Peregrinibacteria bacterium HGW-Peregrinibacteria-1]
MKRGFVNKEGFSLVEVMIGIMVLGVAIVTATSILVGLLKVNKMNLDVLKSYYLAQEGVEAVRNIRDTNWLNNLPFNGDDEAGLYPKFRVGSRYVINLKEEGWRFSSADSGVNARGVLPFDVFEIDELDLEASLVSGVGVEGTYYRYVEFLDACSNPDYEEYRGRDECDDLMLVRAVVSYPKGDKLERVVLETLLTNWKN